VPARADGGSLRDENTRHHRYTVSDLFDGVKAVPVSFAIAVNNNHFFPHPSGNPLFLFNRDKF
jgi:hypothetical protein